jgi:hypothetical protein
MANQLASFLEQLRDENRPVRSLDLAAVSDLSRDQVAEFRAGWDVLRPARRLELMTVMVEQAETNIHLNFHAALRACLTDADAQIRRLAVEGLWEDERVNLIRPLTGLLAHDPAAEVRAASATSLGRFVLLGVLGEIDEEPAKEAAEALRAAWHRAGEPVSVRRRALEGLSHSEAPDLHDLISSAYYDDDALMRQSALFAMGRSANPRWNKIVLAELSSRDAAIRFEAAGAAGEMALRAAVQPLIQRLDDPDKDVREAAALALGKIGGPAARRALERLVGGDDERLAEAAEEALAELSFSSERLDDVLLDYSDGARSHRHMARSRDDDLVDFVDEDDFDGEDSGWDDEDDEDDEIDEDWDDDADDEDDLDWEDEAWDDDEPDMG